MEIETSTYVGELPSQNGHWTNKLAEGKKRVKSTNRDGQVGKTCQSYQGPTLTILICLVFTNLMILWSQKMLGHGKTTRKTIATRLRGWFICFNPEFSLPEFSWFLDLWGQKKNARTWPSKVCIPTSKDLKYVKPAFRKSAMVDEYFLTYCARKKKHPPVS